MRLGLPMRALLFAVAALSAALAHAQTIADPALLAGNVESCVSAPESQVSDLLTPLLQGDVQPVVFQQPLANEPLPPAPPLTEQGVPSDGTAGDWSSKYLGDPDPKAPSPQTAEMYWPDEEPGYDPTIPRGQIRESFARWKHMLGWESEQPRGRYTGYGIPLLDTSWLNRPWSFGAFLGTQFHDNLIAGEINQSNSAVGGARLGLDFDYYWGLEARFAYSNPDTFRPHVPAVIGSSHNYYVDLNLMYYPWGDSRWRPYVSAGLGAGTYRFRDRMISVSDSGLRIPLTVGLKYFYSPWFTLRFDAMYAPTFTSQNFDPQNEFMLSMGAEVRFGGRRMSYFPWHSGTTYW